MNKEGESREEGRERGGGVGGRDDKAVEGESTWKSRCVGGREGRQVSGRTVCKGSMIIM